MTTLEITRDHLLVPDAPPIPGLVFRRFRGEADYPKMITVLHGSKHADQVEEVHSLEALAHSYAHLANCDPYRDMLFVEVDGQVAGYGRMFWQQEENGPRTYTNVGFLLPEWRHKGIGRALLRWTERRAQEAAEEQAHPRDVPRFLQASGSDAEKAKIRLLEREGYAPVRYFYLMVRPDLDAIPEAPLPPGIEVRPVLPEHYRAIWEANVEAFRDHWGFSEPTQAAYEEWLGNEEFAPDIWKVAWDVESNQVAGMVLGFINEAQNTNFSRKRGWTENICVRRPWRKKGLARGLIAENLRELKARGMAEAALGVDTESLTGALRVYESMGFRPVKRETVYRKPMA